MLCKSTLVLATIESKSLVYQLLGLGSAVSFLPGLSDLCVCVWYVFHEGVCQGMMKRQVGATTFAQERSCAQLDTTTSALSQLRFFVPLTL